MKIFIALTALSTIYIGCNSDYQIAKTNPTPYIVGEETTLYEKPNEFSKKVTILAVDDTIIATGRYVRWVETKYKGFHGFALDNNLLTKPEAEKTREVRKYKKEIAGQKNVFFVPKDKAEDSWGRAQSFVGRFSSMKIQVATDYIIQTYNPTSADVTFGYYISRAPVSGGYEYSVKVIYGNMFSKSDAEQNEKVCSYYIETGVLNPEFISK